MSKELSQFVKRLFTTSLGRGSLVMVGGSFGVGFISFLFNPVMGNLLGPVGYGELVVLLSLLVVLSVPSLTLSTVLVKFSARYQATGDLVATKSLLLEISRKLIYFSLFLFLILFVFKDLLAKFLQVDSQLFLLLGGLTTLTIFFTVNGAFLQGLLKFEAYTISSFLNSILRILFAALFVILGFGVGGAIGGLTVALIFTYLLSIFFLKKVFSVEGRKKINWREILISILPAFVSLFGMTLLNNIDVILVKRFFLPIEAGYYGAATTIGKVIVFACLPITQVIFPLVVQKFEAKKPFDQLVFYGLGAIVLIGIGLSTLYLLFPNLVLRGFFFSKSLEYQPAASLLAPYGLFISVFSINTLFIYLFLSLHKMKFALAPLIAGILQGVLIWNWHNSLSQVILMNLIANCLLLISLATYWGRSLRKVGNHE